jgi:hypothetical protein
MPLLLAELQSRIDRAYAAVNATAIRGPALTFPNRPIIEDGKEVALQAYSSRNFSAADTRNTAQNAIDNLAKLYDATMGWAKGSGVPVSDVKAVTSNCLPLLVIRDLYNLDKHPESSQTSTSNLHPGLSDVRIVLQSRPDHPGSMFMDTTAGGGSTTTFEGFDLQLFGQVRNRQTGEYIGSLQETLELGLSVWEEFLVRKGVISQPTSP